MIQDKMMVLILFSFVTLVVSISAECSEEEDICSLPIEKGPCNEYIPRWGFEDGTCRKFIYGGCWGNENNFETNDDCIKECVCNLPAERGPCNGAYLRWAYDSDKNKCNVFLYGGCEGNGNNFKSKEECEKVCAKPVEVDCYAEPDSGPCDGYFTRYYYDNFYGLCRKFIYGGCEGNTNNFESKEDCMNTCGGKD